MKLKLGYWPKCDEGLYEVLYEYATTDKTMKAAK